MTYDIKIFENNEEQETIRNLLQHQMTAVVHVLQRHNIKHLIKDDKGGYWNLEGDMLVAVKGR